MTTENMITIGAAAVAFGSMCAAIVSAAFSRKNAKTAEEAKNQAKQAALLPARSEAIDELDKAISSINKSRVVNPIAKVSIADAKRLAEVVFSEDMRRDLGRAIETADRLLKQRVNESVDGLSQAKAINAFLNELQNLIERMKQETAIR